MKGRILFFSVVLAIAAAVLAESSVLTLSGTVGRTVAITAMPSAAYSRVDVARGGRDIPVAHVQQASTKPGYSVILTSSGAGNGRRATLRSSTASGALSIPYTIKYGGAPVVFEHGNAVLTNRRAATAIPPDNVLTVTIPPSAGATDGSYSDTLVLTIRSN